MSDTTYRLLSAPMIHTPGLLAWAMNAYHFPEDRGRILHIMTETFPTVPNDKMNDLLLGNIPYQIEGDVVVFS